MPKRAREPLKPLHIPLDFDEALKALLGTPPTTEGQPRHAHGEEGGEEAQGQETMSDWLGVVLLVGLAAVVYQLEQIREYLRVLVARSEPPDEDDDDLDV
jgi:hypothetical protein